MVWLIGLAASLLCGAGMLALSARRGWWRQVRRPVMIMLLPAALVLGGLRMAMSVAHITPEHVAWYNGKTVEIQGRVIQPADERPHGDRLTVRVERISVDGHTLEVHGKTLIILASGGGQWRNGDRLTANGQLSTPPELTGFSWKAYLARRGIFSLMENAQAELIERPPLSPAGWIDALRARLHGVILRILPRPEADLVSGILLGIESGLDPAIEQAFQDTGTAHIVAISGFNMAIIANLLAAALRGRVRPLRLPLVVGAVLAVYTLLVGAAPAVARAAVMGWIAVLGAALGRSGGMRTGLTALSFTAALLCMIDPHLPWDVGFQLSFTATLGMLVWGGRWQAGFARRLERWIPPVAEGAKPTFWQAARGGITGAVGEYVLVTLAAQLATLPVVLAHFGRLSLVALIANPLVLPAQPLLMLSGAAAALLGFIFEPLGRLAAVFPWALAGYTLALVKWFGSLPLASVAVQGYGLPAVVASYALMAFFTGGGRFSLRGVPARVVSPGGLLLIASLVLFVWRSALSAPDGDLHVWPAGGGFYARLPRGASVLALPAGDVEQGVLVVDAHAAPFARRMDVLLVAGLEEQHLPDLFAALDAHPPGVLLWQGDAVAGPLLERELEGDVRVVMLQPGQVVRLGGRVSLGVANGEVLLQVDGAAVDVSRAAVWKVGE